jgi:hypothetical protein
MVSLKSPPRMLTTIAPLTAGAHTSGPSTSARTTFNTG